MNETIETHILIPFLKSSSNRKIKKYIKICYDLLELRKKENDTSDTRKTR